MNFLTHSHFHLGRPFSLVHCFVNVKCIFSHLCVSALHIDNNRFIVLIHVQLAASFY